VRLGVATRAEFDLLDTAEARKSRYLVALGDDGTSALLRGTFYEDYLFGLRLSKGDDGCLPALAATLAAWFDDGAVAILTWTPGVLDALNDRLFDAGFEVERTKLFAERRLADFVASPSRLAFRSLAEVGEDVFVPLLDAVAVGDPFEEGETKTTAERFAEEVQIAGEAFDPTWWLVAYLDGTPVGVTLPQRYFDVPNQGTQLYVGLLPEARGMGLGRELHAAGLAVLARHGVERYVGTTDVRNAPMARTFSANGCTVTKRQLFLRHRKGGSA